MLSAILALQVLALLLLAFYVLRRSAAPRSGTLDRPDPRQEALLAADLPAQMARTEERGLALERLLRSEIGQIRTEAAESNARSQQLSVQHGETLRREQALLGEALRAGVEAFRADHRTEAEHFRRVLEDHLNALRQRFAEFSIDALRAHSEGRDALHDLLSELARSQRDDQERIRATVEERLQQLNQVNAAKLEEMRATVDEKLHATLQSRLTESFGAVTDQLTKVHTGLGEMTKLSAGVDDLSRIFTNVKSRGGFAEVQLGMLLGQMLAPSQFIQNARVKPNTAEMVEYAVKLPTPTGEALLPIDAKFPREAWERLETAYAAGSSTEIARAGRDFEAAIRVEGRRICEKYIAPPATTNFGIMFLPTEGLYAEVMRRDGLQAEIQQGCRVTIAGPSTLSAILSSFQMGFHMLQLQQKGDEVWKVLASARTQFGKFEDLMAKMDDQVSKVQKTIQEVGTRTRVINRTLRDVSLEDGEARLPGRSDESHAGYGTLLPMLAAQED